MIPSVLTTQLRRGIEDYLRTTFQISTPLFHRILDDLLNEEQGVFQGPYLSVALPFTPSTLNRDFFTSLHLRFQPYLHQEKAFRRLSEPQTQSTIVATGTGSGKTECFLYPLLDYCYRHRNAQGVKAIVIYPMNALATDQAKRFAKEISRSEKLRNNVSVGLYVGQKSDGTRKQSQVMTADWVIDNRDTLRRMPPDILLTNYKMLDYMLVRARDAALWTLNQPDTLRYVVVDEMHTFDGAQGTDLACLLRRLKYRLKTPQDHLCCVGTSATLGGGKAAENLVSYASDLFGEPFSEDAVITEFRKTPGEFLGDSPISRLEFPGVDKIDDLDPEQYGSQQEFVAAQHALWFEESILHPPGPPQGGNVKSADSSDSPLEGGQGGVFGWRVELCEKLKSHLFFQNFVRVLGSNVRGYDEVLNGLQKVVKGLTGVQASACKGQTEVCTPDRYPGLLLDSLLALVSEARSVQHSDDGNTMLRPFLDVRLQLWTRELTRMVCECSNSPRLLFSDDLTDERLQHCLPLMNCRDCGATGWLGIVRKGADEVKNNLQEIYRTYFSAKPETAFLFPLEGGQKGVQALACNGQTEVCTPNVLLPGVAQKLCGNCLHLINSEKRTECPQCGDTDLIHIFRPDTLRKRKGGLKSESICPFCGGTNTLSILGSRAASITSVVVSQVFASHYNDDKKALAFSDSVQDASHRAGFFGARTYRFNVRGAVQKYIEIEGKGKSLPQLSKGFSDYWRNRLGANQYIATFTAPNMMWLEDFEYVVAHGKLPVNSNLLHLVERRVDWEIRSEYGFNARIGRTLEKTGCSIAHVPRDLLEQTVTVLLDILRNEIGHLQDLTRDDLMHLIYGIVVRLKNQGGIFHEALEPYIESYGNVFRLGQRLKGSHVYMPWFGPNSRAPRFLTTKSGNRFDLLASPDQQRTTWHQNWAEKSLQRYSVFIRTVVGDVYRFLLDKLVEADILEQRNLKGFTIWGLRADALLVTDAVFLLRCSHCGDALSAASHEEPIVVGMPCLRIACSGQYEQDTMTRNYYAFLYKRGDIQRIFAEEHTGLLTHEARDRIEKQFINPEDNACAPNLLSCTPTLEMGIDIGDLSSAVLCSVPPKQANYLQRIGRVGRRDGNGMTITVAGGKPHDLYFFAEPTEMLAGEVAPPGVYLSAPAVLQRQLTAFCFDTWIATQGAADPLPARIGIVLDGLDSKLKFALQEQEGKLKFALQEQEGKLKFALQEQEGKLKFALQEQEGKLKFAESTDAFPFNFTAYVEAHQTDLFDGFISLFPETLSQGDLDLLRAFFQGGEGSEGSMVYRLVDGLTFLAKQRNEFNKRNRRLYDKLRKSKESPGRDKNSEEHEQNLQRERAALNALVHAMNARDLYGWLTDEGLLPNYAFPESGVTLKSVIYRRRKTPDAHGQAYDTWTYEFDRPAVAAIKELAPANSFYAAHRKVEIDQVDLSLSEIETWRFCNRCSFMQQVISAETEKSCPKCGSLFWADQGQQRPLIKLRQVFATTEDSKSRIGDDADERTPVFYNRQLLVNCDEQHIIRAYQLDSPELPFGFEFLKKVVLREINFGKVGSGGASVTIAGEELERSGFMVCKYCGKIQKDANHSIQHTFSCLSRNQNSPENLTELLYLYREYSSEAIRILLPTTTFSKSDEILHSFIAALQLGLKEMFSGSVDHLGTCLHDEPLPNSEYRKRYLVLYDSVPGGTGYLQQLMTSHERMLELLERALRVMEACSCRLSPEKDGCYRCLYAYRNSFDMRSISRSTAITLLADILKQRERFVEIDNLKHVQMNALFDSELEARFLEALRRHKKADRPILLKKELVNKKPGYFLKVNDMPWFIEPQVELGEREGVAVPARADFVFWPGRGSAGQIRPIAVFTDGFMYHQDRIGLDCAQRMAILQSGRFWVWSFSWKDIEAQFSKLPSWYAEYLPYKTTTDEATFFKFFDHYLPSHPNPLPGEEGVFSPLLAGEGPGVRSFLRQAHRKDSFAWFLLFLGNPDEQAWSMYAFLTGLLYKKPGASQVRDAELSDVLTHLPEGLAGHAAVDQQQQLVGYFSSSTADQRGGSVTVLTTIDPEAVKTVEHDKMLSIACLDDSTSSIHGFETIWNGFFRLANLLQFLPNGVFLSRKGCDDDLYGFIQPVVTQQPAPVTPGMYVEDYSWQEAVEFACAEAQPLLEELRKRQITAPQVGYELTNAQGEIIAMAELAWEDKKLVFLTNTELEYQNTFSHNGWRTELLDNTEACLRAVTD